MTLKGSRLSFVVFAHFRVFRSSKKQLVAAKGRAAVKKSLASLRGCLKLSEAP